MYISMHATRYFRRLHRRDKFTAYRARGGASVFLAAAGAHTQREALRRMLCEACPVVDCARTSILEV